jgi:hypothetical protein
VAAPTVLSNAKDVRDLRIVGSAVFYQSGTKIFRVGKDGKGQTEVFSSPDLIRAFVDKTALLTIESTANANNATLRVIKATSADDAAFPDFTPPPPDPAAAPPADPKAPAPLAGTTAAANFNATGAQVFASNDDSFFLLADTDNGDTFVHVDKDAVTQDTIAATANIISHPQLVGTDIWYVQDQQRIFKVGIDDGDAKEIFGIGYATCNLAVNDTSAFCSVGSAVESRNLKGGDPMTVVDAKTSKTPVRFGAALAHGTTLYVSSDGPDPNLKNVIVALQSASTPADEKLVACGRGDVTNITVDDTSVAWTELDGGVFIAPR